MVQLRYTNLRKFSLIFISLNKVMANLLVMEEGTIENEY